MRITNHPYECRDRAGDGVGPEFCTDQHRGSVAIFDLARHYTLLAHLSKEVADT